MLARLDVASRACPIRNAQLVDDVEAAVAKAQQLAGDRIVEGAAGEVGGQVLAAGLVDEVRWTSHPSRSGPASATSGRPTRSIFWRIRTW